MISKAEKKQLEKSYRIMQKRLNKALNSMEKLERFVDKAATDLFIATEDMEDFAGELLDIIKGGN
jgi:transcription initiation factor TFIIIB Brf1 subunit/transcription initiation factor TFIIB